MAEIPWIDLGNGHHDQNIGRPELMVDDRSIANERSKPQITFDERRHDPERRLEVELILRDQVHPLVQAGMRPAAPFEWRQRLMVQQAQRHRMLFGVRTLEARAPDHHVDLVLADIRPQPVPQQLDRSLRAIGLEYAGTAQFQEPRAGGLVLDQWGDVVFALGVEAAAALGHFLAQQPVGADNLGVTAIGPRVRR